MTVWRNFFRITFVGFYFAGYDIWSSQWNVYNSVFPCWKHWIVMRDPTECSFFLLAVWSHTWILLDAWVVIIVNQIYRHKQSMYRCSILGNDESMIWMHELMYSGSSLPLNCWKSAPIRKAKSDVFSQIYILNLRGHLKTLFLMQLKKSGFLERESIILNFQIHSKFKRKYQFCFTSKQAAQFFTIFPRSR